MLEELLVCPVSGNKLQKAAGPVLAHVLERLVTARQNPQDGLFALGTPESVLIDTTGEHVYVVQNEIPRLLPGLQVPLDDVNTGKSVD